MLTDQDARRRATTGPSGPRRRNSPWRPVLFAIAALGFLAAGLAMAGPASAADPTMGPYVDGQHVYGDGTLLGRAGAARVEKLAARIEAGGGGRVVVFTVAQSKSIPSNAELMAGWRIEGLLIAGDGDYPRLTIGDTLKSKLSTDQYHWISGNSSPGMATAESWITSTLARVDAFLGGRHVFDGPGVLDAGALGQAEGAAVNLGKGLGATVYIDISNGGSDAKTNAFFIGADMSSAFDGTLDIAISVSDNTIGGYIDSDSSLWHSYNTGSPWSYNTMANHDAPNGDVQAAVLAAIAAVSKPPLIPLDTIFWIVFVIVVVGFSITAPFIWGPWLIRRLTGVAGPIADGVPGSAIIESIGETGVTVSMPGVGPNAPDYKLGLQVTPNDGSPAYHADIKALIPRIFVPMVVPGARIGVSIDPKDPRKVAIDFERFNPDDSSADAAGGSGPGGMNLDFDASGQPNAAQVAAIVGRVHGGTMPLIKGSADQLLATGTHGTAVITTTQPLGKTVRDINPAADPSRLDDPMWMFTLEVKLPGRDPFPAVMGHRVPVSKVALLGPGVKLAVAVDEADEHNEVAIDWERSPIS
jgi:hypothetical protein